MSKDFLSHPDKFFADHIERMLDETDTSLEREIKLYHDIAKLKSSFQSYIEQPEKRGVDKDHSLLSALLFLNNNNFCELEMMFGFLSIVSHHGNVANFLSLSAKNTNIGAYWNNSKELSFMDEVIEHSKKISLYNDVDGSLEKLSSKILDYQIYLLDKEVEKIFTYNDFIKFKKLYSSLIYSDKYEAIFSLKKEAKKEIDRNVLSRYIKKLPFNEKRANFRQYVLNNFDNSYKLFTLTAPTGYGKTLTALDFAVQFKKEKIIFALPFTSIIDQTEEVISDIFKENDISIYKIHHKTTIDETLNDDRYSQVKFLMNSFSGEINITTLYQIIFTLFGNKNKDNVKFHQFKDSVVIIDEAQAIPYEFRKDFLKLCELISSEMNTVFIFMSATMPVVESSIFKEISNLEYFKEQNRYKLEWLALENGERSLIKKVKIEAKDKHTLLVVNTIKKAQELYLEFKDEYECYTLHGYMTDLHKQKMIEKVRERLELNDSKILLVSTQSIEAGVDLDFEVGFREVSPISSIIQTAGRINRHFGPNQGILYIFDDISEYTDLIYGDLQIISKNIFDLLKENVVEEKEIRTLSTKYFDKIHEQLERLYIEQEIKLLEFQTIHTKIENIMDNNNVKRMIVVEPYEGYIKEIEEKLLTIKNSKLDKYKQSDRTQGTIRKLLQYGVNVCNNDIDNFTTKLKSIQYVHEMFYLPFGASDYDLNMGIKKYKLDLSEKVDDDVLGESLGF